MCCGDDGVRRPPWPVGQGGCLEGACWRTGVCFSMEDTVRMKLSRLCMSEDNVEGVKGIGIGARF